jgi:hypothetical protein
MSLFGTTRDISLFRHINRELINNVIEQQVGYYKINLDKTENNIYGESSGKKTYNNPVLINCLVERNPQTTSTDDFGADINRDISFRFLRDDLAGISLSTEQSSDIKGFTYNIVPEVGDIILWNNDYYEADSITENQLLFGKDSNYSYSSNNDGYGESWSIIVGAHYTRPEKLGITQERL